MHKRVQASVLSTESPAQNYQGFFNLLVIILIVANFRLLVENFLTHGLLVELSIPVNPSEEWGCFACFLGFNLFVLAALITEKLAAGRWIPARTANWLHTFNCTLSLCVPTYVCWTHPENPLAGFALMFLCAVLFLKLVSYAHANADMRSAFLKSRGGASLDLDDNAKPRLSVNVMSELTPRGGEVYYPANLTLGNVYYFWCAPTLSYQLDYPRLERIRWDYVMGYLLRLLVVLVLTLFVIDQIMTPIIKDTMLHVERYQFAFVVEQLLKLAIPSTYVWILFFYGYFHLCLNLLGELLRFGDRCFYKEWWNATTFSLYW